MGTLKIFFVWAKAKEYFSHNNSTTKIEQKRAIELHKAMIYKKRNQTCDPMLQKCDETDELHP